MKKVMRTTQKDKSRPRLYVTTFSQPNLYIFYPGGVVEYYHKNALGYAYWKSFAALSPQQPDQLEFLEFVDYL